MEAVSLKRVYDYEVNRSDLVSPEHSLRVSLARTGKRNFAKSIYFAWPTLEVASRKLAALITHHYPNESGQGFLLDLALASACNVYETSVETDTFTRRMGLYLKTMLDVTAEHILHWDTHGILASGETLAWPVGGAAIQEWVKRKSVEKIVFTKRSEQPGSEEREAARIALASSVMTFNDLLHVTRLDLKG